MEANPSLDSPESRAAVCKGLYFRPTSINGAMEPARSCWCHTPTGKVWGLHFPRQAGSEVPGEVGTPGTLPERDQQA